jgi:hypothetical protein
MPITEPSWPPSDELLAWTPPATSPADALPGSLLADEAGDLASWVSVPDDAERDNDGDLIVPVHELASVETDAGRVGGGGYSAIFAVPTIDGDLRILITNDDGIPFESPTQRVAELPNLGELLRVLDETEVDGEVYGVGHPTRENSDSEHREELLGFVTIRSRLYPQLEALDRARLEQWIAERP